MTNDEASDIIYENLHTLNLQPLCDREGTIADSDDATIDQVLIATETEDEAMGSFTVHYKSVTRTGCRQNSIENVQEASIGFTIHKGDNSITFDVGVYDYE